MDDNMKTIATDNAELRVELIVNDSDVLGELLKYQELDARNAYALAALKVGVLAIKQATGVVDARAIHDECQRFVGLVGRTLSTHAETVSTQVASLLGKYFDPASGELHQRLDRLVRRDGELESLLSRHVGGDGSILAQTLEKQIGRQSPLFQILSPDQRKGILAALKETFELVLGEHGKVICRQFSLDDKESALSRLVSEVTEKNGTLRQELADDLESVCKEFSLDNEEGVLARLVERVERAHRTILNEFSADNEDSALSRMSKLLDSTNRSIDASLSMDDEHSALSRLRREILTVIEAMNTKNQDFQEHVRTTLESLRIRREEAARSTTHGLDFQDVVGEFVQREVAAIRRSL